MLNWATTVGGGSLAASVFSAVPRVPGGRFRGVLRAAPARRTGWPHWRGLFPVQLLIANIINC
jgi:hypothetical protein